jgi:hypothetical protein
MSPPATKKMTIAIMLSLLVPVTCPTTPNQGVLVCAVSRMGRYDLDVLIIPHALLTLPFIEENEFQISTS